MTITTGPWNIAQDEFENTYVESRDDTICSMCSDNQVMDGRAISTVPEFIDVCRLVIASATVHEDLLSLAVAALEKAGVL